MSEPTARLFKLEKVTDVRDVLRSVLHRADDLNCVMVLALDKNNEPCLISGAMDNKERQFLMGYLMAHCMDKYRK